MNVLPQSKRGESLANRKEKKDDEPMLEDKKSWELHQKRLREKQKDRRLHYYTKDERPAIQYDTQHALMIDAGSQGTRIHVYEFEARILSTHKEIKDAVTGRKLTFPNTDSRWTNRKKPGLDVFSFVVDDDEMRNQVSFYLSPLIGFAKDILAEKKENWHNYPIYLKATGGLRALPAPYRLRLMEAVRSLFEDSTFNPFFFETEHARVISVRYHNRLFHDSGSPLSWYSHSIDQREKRKPFTDGLL